MKFDFKINPKTHDANLIVNSLDIKNDNDIKNLLALITIIGADFYLDPEISVEEMQSIIDNGKEKSKNLLINFNEEEINIEYVGV